MSSCEKCWRDAQGSADVAREYQRLMAERKDTPCSPEDQAGPDAAHCWTCGRRTIHQHTSEPMCGCCEKGA